MAFKLLTGASMLGLNPFNIVDDVSTTVIGIKPIEIIGGGLNIIGGGLKQVGSGLKQVDGGLKEQTTVEEKKESFLSDKDKLMIIGGIALVTIVLLIKK